MMFEMIVRERADFGGDVYTVCFDTLPQARAAAEEELRWEGTEMVEIYGSDGVLELSASGDFA